MARRLRAFGLRTAVRLFVLPALLCVPLHGQTIEDGIMMPKRNLFAGYLYSHDSWDKYWEGTLKRVNGNIGTITTQTHMWSGNYGFSDWLNIIGVVPYVKTSPSQGVLRGMRGFQDLTLAGKYNFYAKPFEGGTLKAIAVVSGSMPLTDYTPDFLPLSIGSASKRLTGRFTVNFQSGTRMVCEWLARIHIPRRCAARPALLLYRWPSDL